VAAGEIDGSSLAKLDKNLAKKLEMWCSIPLDSLKGMNLKPAAMLVKASSKRMVQITQKEPAMPWSPKVAVVKPLATEGSTPRVTMAVLSPDDQSLPRWGQLHVIKGALTPDIDAPPEKERPHKAAEIQTTGAGNRMR
jgi:hypothetical protein